MLRRAFSFATVALLAGCASAVSPSATAAPAPARDSRAALRTFLDTLIDAPEFRSAQWGILVVDPVRAETLYSRNADKLFMPASNQKLLTDEFAVGHCMFELRVPSDVLGNHVGLAEEKELKHRS